MKELARYPHFGLVFDHMRLHEKPPAPRKRLLQRNDLLNFITTLYEGDLHAKRVLSLANATLGVLTSASLAIHAVGRGLAQAMGTLTKHGVKQVDRALLKQVWVESEPIRRVHEARLTAKGQLGTDPRIPLPGRACGGLLRMWGGVATGRPACQRATRVLRVCRA